MFSQLILEFIYTGLQFLRIHGILKGKCLKNYRSKCTCDMKIKDHYSNREKLNCYKLFVIFYMVNLIYLQNNRLIHKAKRQGCR